MGSVSVWMHATGMLNVEKKEREPKSGAEEMGNLRNKVRMLMRRL